jgi:apolipoprotein N-acyltransferase
MLLSFRKSLIKLTAKSIEMLVALASGSLMGMTFAPVEAWYLAWFALAPLWYLLCRDRNAGTAIYPLAWGIGCYGFGLAWIFGIHPMTWMGVPYFASLAIATFCLTFITLWGGSLVVLWSLGMRLINTKAKLNPLIRVILGTACWCGLENLYSLSDLWWTSLALSQSPHNLTILHLGQLSGATTVSGAIVLVNGLIAEAFLALNRNRNQLKPIQRIWNSVPYVNIAIAALIMLHAIGWILANRPAIEPIESALKVGIIQGNIGNEVKLYRAGHNLAIENYTKGYRSLVEQGVEAVITPETALPFSESQIKNTPLYQAILEKKVTAFIGGFGDAKPGFTNSILTIAGNGEIFSRYDKWKLVPLGEYIPFEQIIGKWIDRLSPLNSHLVAGKFAPSTMTPFGNFIFGICYDSSYGEHFRRQAQTGSLIITASNDAHYAPAMPAQHHAQDIMRAIETDRWAIRASNTGYSAIIDSHGRTRWISELNQFTTHAHQVYRQHAQNLYVRFGDWLTPLLFAIGLILFIRHSPS